jgi:tRNA(Arg) A34 adenosine deaminase TadA
VARTRSCLDPAAIPAAFGARLPSWVAAELAGTPARLATAQARVRLACRLAERNHREGTGGPFAALVSRVGTGELVAVGVNLVLATGLSALHAEVVAVSLAQVALGTWDLGGGARLELCVNWQPCAMCYGAVLWSGVHRLLLGGDGAEVEALTGFDEGPMRPDWREQLVRRGVAVRTNVLREEALAVLRRYGERTDTTLYNGRRPAPPGGGAAGVPAR